MIDETSCSEAVGESNEQIKYVSYTEHRNFMDDLENELESICSKDPALKETLPLLASCSNDSEYNQHVSQFLNSKVDFHHGQAIELKIKFFNDQTCNVYVNPSGTLLELKRSIERCIGLQLQLQHQTADQGRRNGKVFQRINWKYVWRKYDIWVNRTQRITMCHHHLDQSKDSSQNNVVNLQSTLQDLSMGNQSTLEFILRRNS